MRQPKQSKFLFSKTVAVFESKSDAEKARQFLQADYKGSLSPSDVPATIADIRLELSSQGFNYE